MFKKESQCQESGGLRSGGGKDNTVVHDRTKLYPDLSELSENDNMTEAVKFKESTKLNEPDFLGRLGSIKCYNLIFGILIGIVVVILSFLYHPHLPLIINDYSYNGAFEMMKKNFKEQSDFSWKVINTTLFNHIYGSEAPLRPAVINLVGDMGKVDKLVSELSNVLKELRLATSCDRFVDLDQSQSTDDMQLYIDSFITTAMNSGTKCIHVPHLDQLTPLLGPYLHGLTDEITAKFKDLIYIFSVSPAAHRLASDTLVESVLIDTLAGAWLGEMGPERFDALMSRVAVNVVHVV